MAVSVLIFLVVHDLITADVFVPVQKYLSIVLIGAVAVVTEKIILVQLFRLYLVFQFHYIFFISYLSDQVLYAIFFFCF